MTTNQQFIQLVDCMEEFPHLATGTPQFGGSKSAVEYTWETVASKINAYGPPARTGSEWKKVWIDLKGRLKKKISQNNSSINETGGGPCRVSNLTDLEIDIDRICHISAAAAPTGNVFGFPPKNVAAQIKKVQNDFVVSPLRRSQNVCVVSPTSSSTATNKTEEGPLPQQWVVCSEKYPYDSQPTTSKNSAIETYRMSTSTPKAKISSQRKRKHCDNPAVLEETERLKLLRQQCELQSQTLDAMNAQATSLKDISDSIKLMASSIVDILWHITEK